MVNASAAALAAQLEEVGPVSRLDDATLRQVIEHVMSECDLDGRGRLSYHEFERVMTRFPDIEAKFSINILSN